MNFTSLSIKMYWWKNKQRNLHTFQTVFDVCLRNDAVNYNDYMASVIVEWVGSIRMTLTGEKTKYWEENLSQCHFVSRKPHRAWVGIAPEAPRWEVGEWLRKTVNTIRAGWSRNLGLIHGKGKTFWTPKRPGRLAPLSSTYQWLFNGHQGGRGVKLTSHLQSPICWEGVNTANFAYLKFRHTHTQTHKTHTHKTQKTHTHTHSSTALNVDFNWRVHTGLSEIHDASKFTRPKT